MREVRWCILLPLISACATAKGSLDQCTPFSVMSWNIAAGGGNLSRIAEKIGASSVDIAALQEVDVRWSERSAFVDQADSLAKLLNMSVRFAPIYRIPDTLRRSREFGVAILSRYPIVTWRNHEITRLSTQQQNAAPAKAPGFLEVVIDVRGTKVRAFSTHLDYRADPHVRRMQVAEMLDVIHYAKMPTILAGDLNAPPDAPELKPLWMLRDAAPAWDGGAKTYPAQSPAKRIDYVLVSDEFTVTGARVEATDASDHRPVIMVMKPCPSS
ncbi:MAG TPA: endonuclease/exonuclease/phosphatase family protein [Gemmatimonadaceae bacterium]